MTLDKSNKLTQFVTDSISGKIKYVMGGLTTAGTLATIDKKVNPKDYASIAAEAINQEIVDAEKVSWSDLLDQIKQIAGSIK